MPQGRVTIIFYYYVNQVIMSLGVSSVNSVERLPKGCTEPWGERYFPLQPMAGPESQASKVIFLIILLLPLGEGNSLSLG
ncbi:MAG: hypothetical protein IEMM0008_0803 [bacterium]|nr:MAG: hypothetical protein IEMM0008_0803 [bacterium]